MHGVSGDLFHSKFETVKTLNTCHMYIKSHEKTFKTFFGGLAVPQLTND